MIPSKHLGSCGMPVYANKPVAICKNCDMRRNLSPNPRIIGSMIDESGMIMAGKLVWHDDAWTQLFFGSKSSETPIENASEADLVEQSWENLTVFDTAVLRDLEEQLLYTGVQLIDAVSRNKIGNDQEKSGAQDGYTHRLTSTSVRDKGNSMDQTRPILMSQQKS